MLDGEGRISNIFFLEWQKSDIDAGDRALEKVIAINDGKSVRVNAIQTPNFDWVFRALGADKSMPTVSPKVLRAILARSYNLVRHDIPRKTVEADFQMLERAVSNPEGFSKLFGITTVHDASILAANHPYTLTQVAERVRKNQRWHFADKLIRRVFEETGFDIKASDNKYHRAEKYGKSIIRWYSDAAVSLLKDVYVGKQYEI